MNCANIALKVGQFDSEWLYKYVLEHNPDVIPEKVKSFVAISDYDLIVHYKNGKRELFDIFENTRQYILYKSDSMTEEDHRKRFPDQLRKIMRRKFVNQSWLSEQTGISQGMISKYLTGEAIPGYGKLKNIANALGCQVDDLYLNIPDA